MLKKFKGHRILAIIVLFAAAAWVATGQFAAVGSEEPALAAAADKPAAPPATTNLRTVAAVRPDFIDHAREIRISGVTEPDKQVVLAARADGIVEKLGVEQGADIAPGELVMTLEGVDVIAAVSAARAALNQATEQLTVGEALYSRGSLPELELTARRSAKSAAETALSQARAAEDRLQLKAPFGGTVKTVDVEIGEWVQVGTPVSTILALDPIVVKAEVSELDVGYVAVGTAAKVRLVDGTEMQGTIRHVARQASDVTRTFLVEVALPNADHKIPAGMTAEVRVYAPPQQALLVPRSIITISEAGVIGLRVLGDDDVAAFAPITLIDDTEQGMIVSGVPQGVRVVVAGQDLVRDGDKVIVHEISAAEAAKAMQ
ncbi:efflux RND transporter periplasmic adaptor subunit [Rhodobacter ferrooxidans]|uniref:Efflux transporter, RND family, MFP subunit n=1 Tax=Rhodobacter ferrooxidans TaxID=371731 RepID=C8S4C7_9RHOB|nr:efflux RND transporter periplasmic adaptor subunit [Rhodobacter sp. SW2]EEW24186.1 efflux transporter, RND family, MFP subunit [Rhodobacter sp. SW2]